MGIIMDPITELRLRDEGITKVAQNVEVKIPVSKRPVTIIQNIIINKDVYNLDATTNPFIGCIEIALKLAPPDNKLQWIVGKLCEAAIAYTGSGNKASVFLGMARGTLREKTKHVIVDTDNKDFYYG